MKYSKEKKTVLVVDDDLNMRIFISTLLETSGYKAVVVKNGKEVNKKLQEFYPSLITLDLMMPGEGGILLYQKLKTDEKLKNIPVIVLSGVEEKTFYHSLKTLGIGLNKLLPEPDEYLEKPPKPAELLRVIESLINPEI